MISESDLVESIEPLQVDALQRWIALGWILPQQDQDTLRFDTSDVARVRLICELHYELCIEEDSMSVVLSLMDQLYATRRRLSALAAAVEAQPDEVKQRIATLVERRL